MTVREYTRPAGTPRPPRLKAGQSRYIQAPAPIAHSATPAPNLPPIARRVRAYRRLGFLAGLTLRQFFTRRAHCAFCPLTLATAHPSLYRCSRCRTCGGGDDLRLLRPSSTCPLGVWPAATAGVTAPPP